MTRAVEDYYNEITEAVDAWNREEARLGAAEKYFLGLDLGQAADYSALAVLEMQGGDKEAAEYHCRHLQRWPARTPYAELVGDVSGMLAGGELKAAASRTLAIDATGVGAPVVELFREVLPRADPMKPKPGDVTLRPSFIVPGDVAAVEGGFWRVPKRDLVSTAQIALQTGSLKIAAELSEAHTLTHALETFQVKVEAKGDDPYSVWREGANDGMVFALSFAVWHALRELKIAARNAANRPRTTVYSQFQ